MKKKTVKEVNAKFIKKLNTLLRKKALKELENIVGFKVYIGGTKV